MVIKVEDLLNLVFLAVSEIFSILIGIYIYKYSGGRRITINLALMLIIIPIEIGKFITQASVWDYSTSILDLSPNFFINGI